MDTVTVYIIIDGNNTHEFLVESDALEYIQHNPGASLNIVERQLPSIDLNSQIENIYMSADWQQLLTRLDEDGISGPLLSSSDAKTALMTWNLYNIILRLKNWQIYSRPSVMEYRTFCFLLNGIMYYLPGDQPEQVLDILKQCNVVMHGAQEMVDNLKTLGKLRRNYTL